MTDEKFRVARHAGRLVESRLFALWTDADAEQYARAFWAQARSAPGAAQPVLLADHRPVRAYPASVLARLDQIFASLNVKLERVAVLTDKNNIGVTLQMQGVVDRAGVSHRKLCTDPDAAVDHLRTVLTPEEIVRAEAFVREWPAV